MEDIGAAFVVKDGNGQRLASASLIFSAFLPVHEDYRRDFEVPEFRFSEAVIVRPIYRSQHRFDFELLPFPGFCP